MRRRGRRRIPRRAAPPRPAQGSHLRPAAPAGKGCPRPPRRPARRGEPRAVETRGFPEAGNALLPGSPPTGRAAAAAAGLPGSPRSPPPLTSAPSSEHGRRAPELSSGASRPPPPPCKTQRRVRCPPPPWRACASRRPRRGLGPGPARAAGGNRDAGIPPRHMAGSGAGGSCAGRACPLMEKGQPAGGLRGRRPGHYSGWLRGWRAAPAAPQELYRETGSVRLSRCIWRPFPGTQCQCSPEAGRLLPFCLFPFRPFPPKLSLNNSVLKLLQAE